MHKVLILILGISVFHVATTSSVVADGVASGMNTYTSNTIANGKLVEDLMAGRANASSVESLTEGYKTSSPITSASHSVLDVMYGIHDSVQPLFDGLENMMSGFAPSKVDTNGL